MFAISGNIYNTMYTAGTVNGYSPLFVNYGLSSQANPPVIASLADHSPALLRTEPSGPAPDGYVTAIGGIIP